MDDDVRKISGMKDLEVVSHFKIKALHSNAELIK